MNFFFKDIETLAKEVELTGNGKRPDLKSLVMWLRPLEMLSKNWNPKVSWGQQRVLKIKVSFRHSLLKENKKTTDQL